MSARDNLGGSSEAGNSAGVWESVLEEGQQGHKDNTDIWELETKASQFYNPEFLVFNYLKFCKNSVKLTYSP